MATRIRESEEWALVRVLPKAGGASAWAWWALVVVRGLLPAGFVLAMGWLVSAVQHRGSLATPLVAVGVVFALLNALSPLHSALSWGVANKLSNYLHDKMMSACVDPPGLAHLESPDMQDDLAIARDFDAGISGPPLQASMPEISNGLVEIIAGIAQALILVAYRWWAAVLVTAAWASTHALLRSGAMWRARTSPEVAEEERRAGYEYRLAVDAVASKEIRLFGLGRWLADGFRDRRLKLLDMSWAARRLRERPVLWCIAAIVATNAIVFWFLAHDATSGHLALPRLIVFAQAAVGTSALAFGVWDWWVSTAAQPVPVVNRLAERMTAVGALPAGVRPADGLPAREIRFANVRFSYTPNGPVVLDGLDLAIPSGTSLAIVGQNGAGKTTLAKLLCRFYDPVAGSIHIDGADLRELEVGLWRSRIAAVFQDFVRYELPLRYNVSPRGAPDEEVRRALERARASDLASPDAVLSRAYDGGVDLSGGQWQRIALARALCDVSLGAGLVILDEPTAQLDVRGEAEIFDRLLEATRGRTTVLISHRFSTVRHADRICVLEHGRVIEIGSHDELMASGGRYRQMFMLQASRFGAEIGEG